MEINSNSPIVKSLVDYGLNDKEAKIYLALIELDTATVNEIAHTADINRSSAYVVIEKLKKKGLVSTIKDYKIQRYVATNPEVLLQEAETRALRNIEIKNKIQNVVSELKSIHRETKKKPKIMVYEGEKGIKNALKLTLDCSDKKIRVISSNEQDSGMMIEYVKSRHEKGIKMIGIHPDDQNIRTLISSFPNDLDEYLLLSKDKYHFSADVAIFDDKVGYISNKQKGISFLIQSKDFADVLKTIFDLAHQEAKRVKLN